jgi:biotin carboxyl carrier protein
MAALKISAKAGNQVLELTIERQDGRYVVEVGGGRHLVDAHKLEGEFYSIVTEGKSYEVSVEPTRDGYRVRHGAAEQLVTFTDPGRRARESLAAAGGPVQVTSVMPGKVVRVLVQEGDQLRAGQGILVVEAMKMENEIVAPRPGRVRSIGVQSGQAVERGAVLAVIE